MAKKQKYNWLTKRRRNSFDRSMTRLRGMSTPNPATESGWETLLGTFLVTPEDAPFRSFGRREREDLYKKLDIIFAGIRKIYTTATEPPLKMFKMNSDEEQEEITDHPLLDLLDVPNEFMVYNDIVNHAILQLWISGAFYLLERRNQAGMFESFWPLPTSWVKEIWVNGQLVRFEVKQPKKDKFDVVPEDITAIKFPDPSNPLGHSGPLNAASRAVETDQNRSDYIIEMLKNVKVPGMILTQEEGWTPDQMMDARARLEDIAGKGKRGNPIFISGEGAKAEILTPLSDLDWPGLASLSETRICAVLGVPPILIGLRSGLDRGTYSNFEQAERLFFTTTMVNVWRMLEQALTRGLLRNEGEEDIFLEYDLSEIHQLQEDLTKKADRARADWLAGLITRNEAREVEGRDPLDPVVGDVIRMDLVSVEIAVGTGEMMPRLPEIVPDTGEIPPDAAEVEETEEGGEVDDETSEEEEEAEGKAGNIGNRPGDHPPVRKPAARHNGKASRAKDPKAAARAD